jgi:hypothetical protein
MAYGMALALYNSIATVFFESKRNAISRPRSQTRNR